MERFSKENSLELKGIGIILMFIHHLFLEEENWQGIDVQFLFFSKDTVHYIADFNKVCVAVFLFITAYGMTLKFRQAEGRRGELAHITLKKYLSLLLFFFFVFVFSHILWLIFGGASNLELYGQGLSSVLFFLFDATGISHFYGSPMLNVTWWYMPVVFSALLILPVLWKFYKTIGVLLIPAALLLPSMFNIPSSYGTSYLLTMTVGICAADKGLIEKISALKLPGGIFGKCIKLLCELGLVWTLYRLRISIGYPALVDGCFVLLAAVLVHEFIGKIKGVRWGLRILGKNSMNMFLIHSFIMLYLFPDFIYSFRYGILILLVLLIITLAISYVIEGLKKLCGFFNLHNKVMEKIDKLNWETL